ncbi:MAG TPA: L,D-transpeptidase family protein [Devosia sp.]
MRRLMASLLAGVVLFGVSGPVLAQEVVKVAGIDATRIVIAPPQTELARIIKSGLSAAYQSAPRDTRAYAQAQKLYFFYGARHFEPLWLEEGENGKVTFAPSAAKIIDIFKASAAEGMRPSDYLTPDLDLDAAGTDPAKLAAVETAFSAAAVKYAQDIYGGRIAPTDINKTWTITPKRINEAEMLVKLASTDAPEDILAALEPKHPEFHRLKEALAKFDSDATIDQVEIPEGKTLKPGMTDERVPLLRQRLGVAEPDVPETAGAAAAPDLTYDETLVAAVKTFQESLDLTPDGIAGPATIAALNGGMAASKDDIIANMERWRWEPEDFGKFHVFVNLPEFRLRIMEDGVEKYTTRVVVGTPKNQTPVFSDEIEHIVVNPYWNVPASIKANEIRPHLLANPYYLDGQNMEMLSGGRVVNAAAIDWSSTNIGNFHIRQKPGAGNALGRVKFLFPNQHDIYLHDTPSKSLFARSYRAYSHGCVRVENPMEFAGALTQHEPRISQASLEEMFGPREQWVNVEHKIPVHLTYFTLRVDEDGTIRSFGDVYGANKKLIELLNQ